MLNRKFIAKTLLGSLTLASLALTGCGASGNPAGVDDPYANDPGYTDPSQTGGYTDPSQTGGYGNTTGGYGNNTGGSGYSGTTGGGYNTGMGGELTASVTKVKNGVIFGIGTCKATVEVMNPTQQSLSGTLTVTFTNGGKPTSHVETKQVTVGPGESQTLDFSDKKWSTDNATAEITTNQSAGAATGGYPSTGGYGSTTGGYGSTTGGYGSTTGGYGSTTGGYGQSY